VFPDGLGYLSASSTGRATCGYITKAQHFILGAARCALGGEENCGGWKWSRLQLQGDTIGNLHEDPPSANYRSIITVDPIPFTPLQLEPNRPSARAAAFNTLMEASLNMNAKLFATAISHDRYAGAAAAHDLEWAALQSSAYLHYLHEAAQAMINAGDRLDALLQELRDEGIADRGL
jgi:hypothetical protein